MSEIPWSSGGVENSSGDAESSRWSLSLPTAKTKQARLLFLTLFHYNFHYVSAGPCWNESFLYQRVCTGEATRLLTQHNSTNLFRFFCFGSSNYLSSVVQFLLEDSSTNQIKAVHESQDSYITTWFSNMNQLKSCIEWGPSDSIYLWHSLFNIKAYTRQIERRSIRHTTLK